MASIPHPTATLDDLAREPGKAELIGGTIVRLMPTGRRPNLIAGRVFRSLAEYAECTGTREAYTDDMGFAIQPLRSGRQPFSPDAAFDSGPFPPQPIRFIQGPPTLAVGVRSEAEMAAKRSDEFEAGTAVVWDVDPFAEVVHVDRASEPKQPVTFRRGQQAAAEPAVPGWSVDLDWVFF